MKIAVFHNLSSGGAKRALFNNVNFLIKDHEVDIFVPSIADEDYLPLKDISNNLYTFKLKNTVMGSLYSSFKYFPSKISLTDLEKTQKTMAEHVNKEDYDVIFCEQDKYTMAPFFLKYIKKPHVYYCQQPILSRNEISHNLYKKAGLKINKDAERIRLKFYSSRMVKIDKKLMSQSKYNVANSYFSHESIMRAYGINSFVSYLGVETELFKPMDVIKENFVLSVGACIPEKGFDFIIRSIGRIGEKLRPELWIVSDLVNIHWKKYLENLAAQLKVRLRILILISDDELVKLYNKAMVVVYAPYLEPFGLVPLEAMSCGTPVVGVKEGGVRETIINNHTGILCERDEDDFSKHITQLVTDDHKSEELGKNSVKVVNEFWTLEDSGKRILSHLNRAINYYDL